MQSETSNLSIMDKRLKLTPKQKKLVKRLQGLFEEMKKEQIGVVLDIPEYCYRFYNKADILEAVPLGGDFNEYDTYFDDDEGLGPNGEDLSELLFDAEKSPDQIWYAPSYDNLENIDLGCDFVTDWNYERFAVLLEKNDEVEGELKDQEKEEKLGLLQEELSKKQSKLRRYQAAVKGIKENIAQFKESGMAQEIIDEETAKVASNTKQIKQLKSAIASLKAEIQKVKAQ